MKPTQRYISKNSWRIKNVKKTWNTSYSHAICLLWTFYAWMCKYANWFKIQQFSPTALMFCRQYEPMLFRVKSTDKIRKSYFVEHYTVSSYLSGVSYREIVLVPCCDCLFYIIIIFVIIIVLFISRFILNSNCIILILYTIKLCFSFVFSYWFWNFQLLYHIGKISFCSNIRA